MKQKVMGENIAPKCAYCRFGALTADKTAVLCPRRGVTPTDDACKKFRYDPCKREPRPAAPLQQFSAEDFSLD